RWRCPFCARNASRAGRSRPGWLQGFSGWWGAVSWAAKMRSPGRPQRRGHSWPISKLSPISMSQLTACVAILGLILTVVADTTLVFKKIRQPLVLGYIIAGLFVGPHMPFTPTVIDDASIGVWSQLGVVFLLFSLGLEFSFKKVIKVGGSAGITALVTVSFM